MLYCQVDRITSDPYLMSNLKTAFDETIANKYFKLGVWLAPQQ